MMDLNVNDFMTEEEMKAQEKEEQQMENEALSQYDRFLYCADTNRIMEIVQNVFMAAQQIDQNNAFFEASDNYIKWSLQALSAVPAQLIVVEGLLSHRMQAGLLGEVYESESLAPFKALPSSVPMLKNTAFLGKIKDMQQVENIKENVIRVAGIDPNSNQVAVFAEPLNAALPQMTGYCIALISLTDIQMSNLKKASKVKKVSDKMQKASQNFNTSTYGVMKMGLEGVATPALEMAGKSAGLVVGTLGTASFKAGASAIAEITGSVARADLRNCQEVQDIKHNIAVLMQQFGKGKEKDDSFSFNF